MNRPVAVQDAANALRGSSSPGGEVAGDCFEGRRVARVSQDHQARHDLRALVPFT